MKPDHFDKFVSFFMTGMMVAILGAVLIGVFAALIGCAEPHVDEFGDLAAEKREGFRSWTEFCQSRIPGCKLKGLDLLNENEVCICARKK